MRKLTMPFFSQHSALCHRPQELDRIRVERDVHIARHALHAHADWNQRFIADSLQHRPNVRVRLIRGQPDQLGRDVVGDVRPVAERVRRNIPQRNHHGVKDVLQRPDKHEISRIISQKKEAFCPLMLLKRHPIIPKQSNRHPLPPFRAWGDAGALPQTLPEALPLDSTRGNCPLTPSRDSVGDNCILCPRVY